MVVHIYSAELNAAAHHLDEPRAAVYIETLGVEVQHTIPAITAVISYKKGQLEGKMAKKSNF